MKQLFNDNRIILMEAAIAERLRRNENISLDSDLIHASLIYDDNGKNELAKIYMSYIEIAKSIDLPFLMCTPTRKTNYENIIRAKGNININSDTLDFLKQIRDSQGSFSKKILIGGLIGCKNDCYLPEEGLTTSEAEKFHTWQIIQFANNGADFLIAATMPNVYEALGVARAMEKTNIPYIISFVIGHDGLILDGTSLLEASGIIDEETQRPPIGYMINCSYPTFLQVEKQPKKLFDRLIGYQANGSSLNHSDLDDADQLMVNDLSEWGEEMLKLNRKYGVKIIGGCCGTGPEHLEYIVKNAESL